MPLCICAHKSRYQEVIGSPAAGEIGGYEPPIGVMGTELWSSAGASNFSNH